MTHYDAYIMMARTQISLDPGVLRRARRRATEAGISLAEYVRRLIERDLQAPRAVREPAAVFNLGDSGGADVARQKDRMLGEAVEARRAPSARTR